MKSRNILKKTVIAAATLVVLATAIFAGTRIFSTTGHSYRANDFTQLPSQQELEKSYDFSPKVVESFANGYTFTRGTPVSASATNEDGSEVEAYTGLALTYALGQEQVDLYANASAMQLPDPSAEVVEQDGVTFYYASFTQKFVPANYELTEQDKLDQANGTLNIGYGAQEVETNETQNLSWTVDGINYTLLAVDSSLSQSDLLAMAAELLA